MHIRQSLSRTIRNLNLALHLTIETTLCVIAAACFDWRKAPAGHRLNAVCRKLPRSLGYYVSWAVDPHDYFTIDGDEVGRRRSRLDPAAKKQRRALSDLRRRRIGVLLHALGDTPQKVHASLTRQWLIGGANHSFGLLEDYLFARLRHSDPNGMRGLIVSGWACNIGGTWVATPKPVRLYLTGAVAHQYLLEDTTHLPRRGPRILTNATGPQPMANIRACRCCAPLAY